MKPLVESPIIARARDAAVPLGRYDTGATAAEWFVRRTKANRMNNREVRTMISAATGVLIDLNF